MKKKTEDINKVKTLSEDQYESLYQISRVLNSANFQEDLIEEALDIVVKIIDAERGLFVKYDDKRDDFEIISARNNKKENIEDIEEFSSSILREVIKNKKPLLHHDVQSDPQLSQFESIQIQKIKSVVVVPVFKEEKVWGVILADSQMNRKEFTEENLKFLDFFSNIVSLSLEKIFQLEDLKNQNLILINKLQSTEKIPDMIGESSEMRKVAKLIHKVARSNATVLILGESGTGKDLAAKAIHKLSDREDEPYLAQFCGSIPDNLLESELFGFKKGSFTGADSDKKGLLEVADKGTFFLDEIAEISQSLQAKLLRVLENKEIMRIGDTKAKKIDVRIIAATNKDLYKMVEEGKFREDLFYRLNIFPIKLPPLRDRKEDIPQLAYHFAEDLSGGKIKISPSAMGKLEKYHYPGNVRQLLNIIHRAVILSDSGTIDSEHVIFEDKSESESLKGTLKDVEVYLLKKRMKEFSGNKTQAAESLGVSVRWVQLKLKEIEQN